jgi:hypothetical protein
MESARDRHYRLALEQNRPGLIAARDFGAAADLPDRSAEATGLIDELRISMDQLRDLLASGAHVAVSELALSVIVLAERIRLELDL